MTTDVWVTGIGLCSALGATLDLSWQALLQGSCGICSRAPYGNLPLYPLGMIANAPMGLFPLLTQVVQAAMTDARLCVWDGEPLSSDRCGVSVGSSRGYQLDLERFVAERSTPKVANLDRVWLQSYGQSPAGQVAQQLQWCGPTLSPRAACATGIWAIAQGLALIQSGQCDLVVAGAAEAPLTPLTLAGFHNMGALAKVGAFPFDHQRAGFVLAEGAALLVLERRDHAEQRGARPYGQVLGFGFTNDAYHCTAPDPNQSAAIAAIENCLTRSHLQPHQVGYIHAHGTGTRLNDEREATMIQALFPRETTAVSSTKGATGHPLGASGALGAAFCLMALYKQILPPSVGLSQPDHDLNWVFQAQSKDLDASLCLGFGFGGQNAAISFGRIPGYY